MSNIIRAIINIYNCPVYNTGEYYKSKTRANSMGDAMEFFIKDSFANSYGLNEKDSLVAYQGVFSYLGNQNNPPDMILKNSDAIEVKKIESFGSSLALNSSSPKAKLFRDSSMITAACRECEDNDWVEKDIIYAVGVVKEKNIRWLSFVYGEDYAACAEIYDDVKKAIKNGVEQVSCYNFSETNELGRINRVDPLGITNLRIRGMWQIESPFKVFNNIHNFTTKEKFSFFAIINEEKYNVLNKDDIAELELISEISINDITISDPNNPAKLKQVKAIRFER